MNSTTKTIQRGIDVLAFLSGVVQNNTEFYQSDFNYDIAILQNAAKEHGITNRSFLWMSRRSGTWCLNEREVFLRDTGAFSTWTYYETAATGIQAYRIAVTGCREGTVIGDIFPLNYTEHVRRVKQNALSIQFVTASFEDGSIMTMEHDEYRRGVDPYFGAGASLGVVQEKTNQGRQYQESSSLNSCPAQRRRRQRCTSKYGILISNASC